MSDEVSHERAVEFLRALQRELTLAQSYRDQPGQGHLDTEALRLDLEGDVEVSIRVRVRGPRFDVNIITAAPPLPALTAVRLAAILLRKPAPPAEWLRSILPESAEDADILRAGDAWALRFEGSRLPDAKSLSTMVRRMTNEFRLRSA